MVICFYVPLKWYGCVVYCFVVGMVFFSGDGLILFIRGCDQYV